MGFLTRNFEKRDISLTSNEIIELILGNTNQSFTGESITVEGALNVTSVLAGFTILMEDISSLPLITYRRVEGGKQRAHKHPYYQLLHDNPNPEHTSMVFRELMIGHLLGWGNFYGQLIWDGRGVVREVWPLAPNRMEVFREGNGERRYLFSTAEGNRIAFRQDQILHIPAFGFDGLQGYSRISMARNAIGLARAAEKYGSKMFANDARPSVLFKSDKQLTKDAKKTLRETWQQIYGGADNAGKSAVLEHGIDIETIGFPPEDAQFLQTRQFQVSEIARIFRIPPHMLGHTEKSTSWGTGIEQQELGYLNHTLRPWLVRVEQQLHKDLLLGRERRSYLIEHLTDGLLRADSEKRAEMYAKAILNGWMSPNEVRAKENMLPYEGGDQYRLPLNTEPADGGENGGSQTQEGNARNMTPIFLDTAQRCVRRESQDVCAAEKRWLDNNKPDKFDEWLERFYTVDQYQYMLDAFLPFVRAGLINQRELECVAKNHCESQGVSISGALVDQTRMDDFTANWIADHAQIIVRELMED